LQKKGKIKGKDKDGGEAAIEGKTKKVPLDIRLYKTFEKLS